MALNPSGSRPFGNAVSLGNPYKHAMISELQVQFHKCTAPGKGQTETLKNTLWLYNVVINTLEHFNFKTAGTAPPLAGEWLALRIAQRPLCRISSSPGGPF